MTPPHPERVILVGGFHEIIELCDLCGTTVQGIIDAKLRGEYLGHRILGTDDEARAIHASHGGIPLIITPDEPRIRCSLANEYRAIGFAFASLVHPDAVLSGSAVIGEGTVMLAGTSLSASSRLGDFVKVNTCANITHDVVVGDFSTIAPSAVLLGRVRVGRECYVGANSTILPDLTIGDRAVVGAGAVVTRDVSPGTVVAGVPARELRS